MKDFERYVKVSGSNRLHATLAHIAKACSKLNGETSELKSLEAEKYRVYAEARSVGRTLISDIKELNSYLGEPKQFMVSKAPVAKKKVAPRRAPPRRPTPRPKKVPVAKRSRPMRRVAPVRPIKKATAKRRQAKKARAPATKNANEAASLKRLKANLDAIRASLK